MRFLRIRSIQFITIIFSSFLWWSPANSTPFYFTIGGGYINSIDDGAGIITNMDLNLGDPVSYKLLINFQADGYVIKNDGTREIYNDLVLRDYFFCEYISGPVLNESEGGYFNGSNNIAQYCFGYIEYMEPGYSEDISFLCNSQNNPLFLTASVYNGNIELGSTFAFASSTASNSQGNTSSFTTSGLTVTDISQAPVPEPSTIILLLSGLLCISRFSKKK